MDPDRWDRVMIVVNHHRQLLDFQNITKQHMDNMENFLWNMAENIELIVMEANNNHWNRCRPNFQSETWTPHITYNPVFHGIILYP